MKTLLPEFLTHRNMLRSGFMLSLLFFAGFVKAQSYLPNYSFTPTITTYTPITGGTLIDTGPVDDNDYYGFNIGFPFNFNGTTYSTFSINSNGVLVFGSSYNYVSNYAAMWDWGSANNAVMPLNADIMGLATGAMRFDNFGTAPNRYLVVQWSDFGFWNSTGDSENFQIVLRETSNAIEFNYGIFTKGINDHYPSVGIRGSSPSEFVNRMTSVDWAATTAGFSPYDNCMLSNNGPVLPYDGLTFAFNPPPLSYVTSIVNTASTQTIAPASSDQKIIGFSIEAYGMANYLPLSEITVSTSGTTNLADLANLKIYYTGTSSSFSTGTQFGTTVSSPAAVNLVTDSVNLSEGQNYFWITYDLSPGATIGNVVDASVTMVKTKGTNHVPTVTSPSGNRQIEAPMSYVSASAIQPFVQKVGQGTENNQVIALQVVTSSTGAPINATQIDFSANGTTDTADIQNMKVWYTGNSNAFSTGTQFGNTLDFLPGTLTFSITGSQELVNDTNYFWLSYDVDPFAILGNFVDGECSSVVVAGLPQTPTVTAPSGNREVRVEYCTAEVSQIANTCNWGYYLSAVYTYGAVSDLYNVGSGCNGNPNNNYIYYQNNHTLVVNQNQTITINIGDYSSYLTYAVWIDYNQDGVFDNVTERVFQSPNPYNYGYVTGSITIPCDALTGPTRMRVRGGDYWWNYNFITNSCSDVGYGETEDYNVTILPNPVRYDYSTTLQQTGIAAPGTNDLPILRVELGTSQCGVPLASTFTFSTSGTSNTADIVNAKLYKTGTSNVFSNTTLIGTVAAPSGQFSFAVTDTPVVGQATYYWLAYDIGAGASLSNVVDATFDSVEVLGAFHIPDVVNPSGNITLTSPMSYVSADVTQTFVQKIGKGTADNQILALRVVTSSTGAPAYASQVDFTINGTTTSSDVANMKVWYTGNSNVFATTTQFGNTVPYASGVLAYSATGNQPLTNDTNYFWVTFDIDAAATIGNLIDGECTGVIIGGTTQTPSVSSPAGTREVREEYCEPIISNALFTCNNNSYINSVYTYGAVSNLSNFYNGCNGNPSNNYINYPNQTLVVNQNQTININLGDYYTYMTYTVWIDYNQDGVFDNITERAFQSPWTGNYGYVSGSINIPCDALPGQTRMRVRGANFWWMGTFINDPCSDVGEGETEDYNVEILPNPLSYDSYADQQSSIASPGTTDKVILQVPIYPSGCGDAIVSQYLFSTSGTTSAGDIANAKLYKTGGAGSFSSSNLIGTVAAPSGPFSFSVTDTLTPNETNYYWLTYDISASATLSNTLDATFDSLEAGGVYYVSSTSNPSGDITITAPMSYLGAEAIQPVVQKVAKGTLENQVMGLRVIMSGTGAPVSATQVDFNINGTTDPTNVTNMKVWYTGNSKKFVAKYQFGSDIPYASGVLTYGANGNQELLNDTNYFWVTYDIDAASTIGNVVDGECTSITIGGVPQIPSVTAPAGSREIVDDYCTPLVSNATNSCWWGYYISSVYTYGAVSDLSNFYSGCNGSGSANNHEVYPDESMVVMQSQTISINIGDYNTYLTYAVWIDFDQDGVFNNTTERVFQSPYSGNYGYVNGTITIPCTALPGQTRMRVRGGDYWWSGNYIADACSDIGYGEAEDYSITILPNAVAYGYSTADQQTGLAAPGTTNLPVLKVSMAASNCGTPTVSTFKFATTGTTNTADIVNAKLYKTGTSDLFSTTNLLGTVPAPSGQFTFTVTDSMNAGEQTYYWLAYDLSGSATLGNNIDARFDSVEVLGAYHIPDVTNPSGSITVSSPMAYISSAATQSFVQKVGKGTMDNEVIGVQIVTSSTGAPKYVSQFDFSAAGTTDSANIRNMKVWYTGNSNAFATNTQFGSTLAFLPGTLGFSITGTQALGPDTNYFWLTYDVDAGATLGNLIDAECSSVILDGIPQTPSVTAPAGSREVRDEYCAPLVSNAVNSCNWGYYTSTFYTYDAVSNISNWYSGCNGNPVNNYINYANTTLVVNQNQTIHVNIGDYNTYMTYAIWIDYNQDGVFDNTTERVFQSPYTGNYGYVDGYVTIPCDALTGPTRMRVRSGDYWWSGSYIANACNDVGYGETEDYNVMINPNPVSYDYSTAEQQTGIAAPGTNDLPILRVDVSASNCGVPTAEAFVFSTSGTTSPADILNAKLYKTGASSAFNTSTLVGTIPSPSGQFTFIVTDTLESSITTYYWLAYDVNPGAGLSNVIDATFDSVSVLGMYHTPYVTNPADNIIITSPMTYVSSEATQTMVQKVGRGTPDNQVLGVQVVTSSTGAPAYITQLDFNLNGSTTAADVTNMKVWYTGNSNEFDMNTQFGSTIPYSSGVWAYSAIGNMQLLNDTNYFWITYDIDAAATLGNLLDGECTGVIVAGIMQIPSVTIPAGSREIRDPYCTPLVSNAVNSCNWGYYISTVYTNGAVSNIGNYYSGCNGNSNNHITYNNQTLVINQNQTVTINLGDYNTYLTYAVWIDYNQDGVFDNVTERVFQSPYMYNQGFVNGSFTVPITALTGQTLMRVRGGDWWWTGTYISDPCSDIGYGETEDYMVNILPEPPPVTYVWNQTGTADFGWGANWTPGRWNPMVNDKLVFNGGGAVTANYVNTQKIGTITVENGTEVTLETSYYTAIPLIVSDSVVLTSGSITTGTNLVLQLGTDTGHIGAIGGTGSVGGMFRRWINPAVTSYDFPMTYNGDNNLVNINYTTPPTAGGTLTASRIPFEPGQLGLPLVDGSISVNKASNFGVWRLKNANGLAGGAFTGTFTADGITEVTNPADLVITRRLVSIAMWTLNGTSVTTTGTTTAPVLSRTGMTVYGEFGVGGDGVINPLPVKLISFKANALKGDVLTSWTTASEINNAGFEVQRSVDGKTFTTVGFVKGRGNSSALTNYAFTDKSAFNIEGVSKLYYRLRQIDNDGSDWISEVATVTNGDSKLAGVAAYPNPFNGDLHIDIVSTEDAAYAVTIMDIQGKVIFTADKQVLKGINTIQANGLDELKAGIYFLRISGPETKTLKLVKTDRQ